MSEIHILPGEVGVAIDNANLLPMMWLINFPIYGGNEHGNIILREKVDLIGLHRALTLFAYCCEKDEGNDRSFAMRWQQIFIPVGSQSENFAGMLASHGFDVFAQPMKVGSNMDTNLVFEVMRRIVIDKGGCPEYVFLISGDADFAPLVLGLKQYGVKVVVISHSQMLSARLAQSASHVLYLEKIWSQLSIKSRR